MKFKNFRQKEDAVKSDGSQQLMLRFLREVAWVDETRRFPRAKLIFTKQ